MSTLWYKKKANDEVIKSVRYILKNDFGVRMHFKKVLGGGQCDYWNGIVEIDPGEKKSIKDFLGIVFHELGHVMAYRQGYFPLYHYDKEPQNKKELANFRRTAYRAEQFVDKMGKELQKIYFPDVPYKRAYNSNADKKWYYDKFLNKYYPLGSK